MSTQLWKCNICRNTYEQFVFCCDQMPSIIDKASSLNSQEGGDHYKKLADYQPWVVLSKWMTPEEMKGAMKKDVIAYLARESDKGGREDIKKAIHTMQMYLELTEEHMPTKIFHCPVCDAEVDHRWLNKAYHCNVCDCRKGID